MALKFLNDGFFDGKVGIGTDSPDATLEPVNISATSDGDGSASDTLSGQDSILLSTKTGTFEETSGAITWRNSTRRRAMITGVNEAADGDGDILGLAFYTQGTDGPGDFFESMRIAHSGNVGIGTTNPLAKLHVKETTSDIAGQIIVGGLIDGGTDDVAFGVLNFANINVANTQTNDVLASISGEKPDSSNRGELVFRTSNDAAPAERMRIDNEGNVRIGAGNPGAKLDVVGSVNNADIAVRITNTFDDDNASSEPTAALLLEAVSSNAYLRVHGAPTDIPASHKIDLGSTASNSFLTFSPSDSEKMRIDKDGNVGIGTTSPDYPLEVNDRIAIKGSTVPQLMFFETDSTYTDAMRLLRLGDKLSLTYGWNVDEEALTVVGGTGSDIGFVGIGTTSPQSQLHVDGVISVGDGVARSEIKPPTSGNANMTFAANAGNANTAVSEFIFTNSLNGSNTRNESMRIDSAGKVGIGTTAPGENLEVIGNSITRNKTRGLGTNYATSEGWLAGAASTFTSRDGFFGGNFVNNGPSAENKVEFDDGPFGSRELVWMTVPEAGNNADGGWDKAMDGFSNATNNGFMSVVYVRRDSGTASGQFFLGCSNSVTNNLDGTDNTNPYFIAGVAVSTLPIDVWCVAIGIIYASSDSNTSSSGLGGVYRLDTGERLHTATTFRQKPSQTIQEQRVYHFYSTNTTAQLDFAKPGFYILDGSEPTLSELTAGAVGGDDVFWSAEGNNIYNDNTGNVAIGTTTYSTDQDLNLSGKGVAIKNTINGNNNNWSYIYNTAVDNSSNLTFATGNELTALTLAHNGDATFVRDIQLGGTTPTLDFFESTQAEILASIKVAIDDGTGGKFTIQTKRNGDTAISALVIDDNQNVGIGTNDPDSKFEINDGFNINGNLRLGTNDIPGAGGWARGMTTLFANTSTGKKSFVRQGLLGEGDDLDYWWHSMDTTTTTPWSNNAFRIYPNNNIVAGISGGKVGIGTITPSQLLHVKAENPILLIQDNSTATTNASSTLRLAESDAAGDVDVYWDIKQAPDAVGTNLQINHSTLGNALTVLSTGNVGIGESNPSALLHVRAANNVTGTIEVQGGKDVVTTVGEINSELNFGSNDASIAGGIGGSIKSVTEFDNGARVGMSFYTAKQGRTPVLEEAMRIDHDGKLGIGTTTPDAPLEVIGLLGIRVNEDGLGTKAISLRSDFAGLGPAVNVSTNHPLLFQTNNNEKMRISAGGNVGIGETDPGEKLDVKGGNIRLVDASAGLIFTAPNGKLWKQTISNTGVPVYTDVSP